MREVWKVRIYSMKDGRKDIYETESDSIINASRVILSFKGKRGYDVVKYTIEREWWLL